MTQEKRKLWRTTHHVVGVLVVGGFLTAMGIQVFGDTPVALDPANAPPPSADAIQRYYGVYYNGQKIGWADVSQEPTTERGTSFRYRSYLKFRAQAAEQKLSTEYYAEAKSDWTLKKFAASVKAGPANIAASGGVDGDTLTVEIDTGGQSVTDRIKLDEPVFLPNLVRPYVAALKPVAGSHYAISVYNPWIRTPQELEIVVEEVTADGYRLSEIFRGSMSAEAWIDMNGITIREKSLQLGFEMIAEDRDKALALPEGQVPDLVFAVSVPVDGVIPTDGSARKLALDLSGPDLSTFAGLQGGRQMLEGSVVHIHARGWPERGGYTLPYDGVVGPASRGSAAPPDGWRDALASEPLVQAGDPKIQKVAVRVLGGERDPVKAAQALYQFVYEEVDKKNSVGVPSALEVLATMEGDCNEHTVLYTALARSVGLPTRMAAGVVYTQARGIGAGMYYHAWPEVWVGDRWVAIDPTIGQSPADATHVRFVIGGLDQQVDILRLIGTLKAKVVAVNEVNP